MENHKKFMADKAVLLGEKLFGFHNYAHKKGNKYFVYMNGEDEPITVDELAKAYERYLVETYGVAPSKVAAFVAATVILSQTENDWSVSFSEIEDVLPSLENSGWSKDEDYLGEVVSWLYSYPQFEGDGETVEIWEDCFCCVAWTDHIACEYNADEGEEDW